MKNGHKRMNALQSAALMIGGNILYALSVKLFLLPANLMSSGTTGLGLVVNHLTGFPLTTFILIFNVLMLVYAWFALGRRFVATTIVSSLMYPVLLEMFNRILGDVHITDNMLLNTLFAGMGLGLALGTVLRSGASTGGLDIPLLVLQKKFRIPVSVSLYVMDFCIVTSQLLYHTLEDLLYGVLLLLMTSLVLNKAMIWGVTKTEVKIISEKSDEIRKAVLSEMDRGVTMLYGKGGYSGKETQVLMTVVSNREVVKIERIVREVDPMCFMVVSRVSEVWGRGFSVEKNYK